MPACWSTPGGWALLDLAGHRSFQVEQGGVELFSQSGWHPETVWFEEPQPLEVGTLEFTCRWENPTDEDVHFGPGAEDEMCFVFGWATGLDDMYWQANYSGCEAVSG